METDQEKGPVWNRFKNHLHGRIVQNKEKGGTGVVVGQMSNKIKILWLNDVDKELNVQEYEINEIKDSITDAFDLTFAFNSVKRYQDNGWHRSSDDPDEDLESPEGQLDKTSEVVGLTGTVYPPDVCFTEGDIALSEWVDNPKYFKMKNYVVERIVDDRSSKKGRKEYLIKWKGYELNPGSRAKGISKLLRSGDWVDEDEMCEAEALDVWEKKKPEYYIGEDTLPEDKTVSSKRKRRN